MTDDYRAHRIEMTKARLDREVVQLQSVVELARLGNFTVDPKTFGSLVGGLVCQAMETYDTLQTLLILQAAPRCGGCGLRIPNWQKEQYPCLAGGYATCFPRGM